jgi:hypothetical protein
LRALVSETIGAADGPRFCVRCGTGLNGPFCYACGAPAQGPASSAAVAEPRRAAVREPAVRPRLVLPPLPALGAASAETAMFAGAAVVVGLLLLAFPTLGLLAGLVAFGVLLRRSAGSGERPDEAR